MSSTNESEGWYPGKYAGAKKSSASTPTQSSTDRNSTSSGNNDKEEKEKWYPGKYVRRMSTTSTSKSRPPTSPTDRDNEKPSSPVLVDKEGNTASIYTDEKFCIGKISLHIEGLKYFYAESCIISVSIEKNVMHFPVNDMKLNSGEITATIPIHDISSNILIQFLDQTNHISFGRVIMPVMNFVDVLRPKETASQWYMLNPPYKHHDSASFYRTGLEGVPDYAMSRPCDALGFVKLGVHVELIHPPYKCLLRDAFSQPASTSTSSQDIVVKSQDIFQGEIRLKYLRFLRLWTLPPLLSSFMMVPAVFIFIGTVFFFAFTLELHHISILFLAALYYNGQMSKEERSFAHFIMWNNPVIETRMSNNLTSSRSVDHHNKADKMIVDDSNWLQLFEELDTRLDGLATNIEKWTNLWSFADPVISMVAYGVAMIISVILSLFTWIFGARFVIFVLISIVALLMACKDVLLEIHAQNINSNDTSSSSTSSSSVSSSKASIGVRVGAIVKHAQNFWARVPDELEMFHRHVCLKAIVKEGGGEMVDAAIAHKTT